MTEIILYFFSKGKETVYFHLEAEPFTRKTIYGSRKVIALDKNGNQCKTAQLSCDGTEIFPGGGTGFVKLTTDGKIFENKNEAEQELAEKTEHTFKLGEHNYSMTKIESDFQLNAFFEQEIEKLYVLGGISSSEMIQFLGEDLYEFSLNHFRKAYVFCRNRRIFMEIAKDKSEEEKHTEFMKRENYEFLPDSELALDDIDFGMM